MIATTPPLRSAAKAATTTAPTGAKVTARSRGCGGRALSLPTPSYYHCDLVRDAAGVRLAKRHDALALRTLRLHGLAPSDVLHKLAPPMTSVTSDS